MFASDNPSGPFAPSAMWGRWSHQGPSEGVRVATEAAPFAHGLPDEPRGRGDLLAASSMIRVAFRVNSFVLSAATEGGPRRAVGLLAGPGCIVDVPEVEGSARAATGCACPATLAWWRDLVCVGRPGRRGLEAIVLRPSRGEHRARLSRSRWGTSAAAHRETRQVQVVPSTHKALASVRRQGAARPLLSSSASGLPFGGGLAVAERARSASSWSRSTGSWRGRRLHR